MRLRIDPSSFCAMCGNRRCTCLPDAPDQWKCDGCKQWYDHDHEGHYGRLPDGTFGYLCPPTMERYAA